MTNAEKINKASNIIARGLMILHYYYLKNDKLQELFFEAEETEETEKFFLENLLDFPLEKRQNLSIYYNLCRDYSKLSMEKTEELMNFRYDSDDYHFALEKGILDEFDFIENNIPESVQKHKIIELYNREIEIISKNADLIINLDIDNIIEKQFKKEINEFEYFNDLIYEDTNKLAKLVLQKFNPIENMFFEFDDDETFDLIWKEFYAIGHDAIEDSDLDEYQKDASYKNPEFFFQYLLNKQRNLVTSCSFFLFLQKYVTYEQLHDEGLLMLMWVSIENYRKSKNNSIDDFLALKKAFIFLNDLYDELNENDLITNERIHEVKYFILENTAENFEKLWEFELAAEYYKKSLILSQEGNEEGQELNKQPLIVNIIDCIVKFDKIESIKLMERIIDNDLSIIGIKKNYKLTNSFKELIESQLVQTMLEIGSDFTQLNIKSDLVNRIFKLMNNLKISDNVSTEEIEKLSELAEQWNKNLYEENFGEMTSEEKVKGILEGLKFIDPQIEVFENKIKILNENKSDISDKILLLKIELYNIKLSCIKGDINSVSRLSSIITNIEKHFDNSDKTYWYQEYIRFISLNIYNKTDNQIDEIIKYSIKTINLILIDFFTKYKEDFSQNIAQSELEKLLQAIFYSINLLENKEVRHIGDFDNETKNNSYSSKIEILIKLCWNLIFHKNKIFNDFMDLNKSLFTNSNKFEVLIKDLKKIFYNFNVNEQNNEKNQIIKIANEIALQNIPMDISNLFLNKLIEPESRTITYFIFANVDKDKSILSISYNPNGHDKRTNIKFNYNLSSNFEEFENLFFSGSKYEFQTKGITAFLNKEDKVKNFHDKLLSPFYNFMEEDDSFEKLNALFNDFSEDKNEKSEREDFNIISDSFLHRIPFEYLTPKNLLPLGLKHNITYIIKNIHKQRKINLENGVVFFSEIPEVFSKKSNSIKYPFLKYSNVEVSLIIELCKTNNIKTHSYTGNSANLFSLKNILEKKPSILHFSTHGIADTKMPACVNSLLLAKENEAESSVLLLYHDILQLDLKGVELVILSACNSSLGEIKRGVSMQGVAYAFLYAGAKYVLATKNEIDDSATSVFMYKFYQFLIDNSVSNALRQTRKYFHDSNFIDFKFLDNNQNEIIGVKKEEMCKFFLANWGVWQ